MIEIKKLKELTSSFNVLYVEDDKSILESMSKYLQKLFKSVVSAANGKEGLELFKNNSIDIVITDLSMPVMNGLDMIEKIKAINENQAVLITTAHSDPAYLLGAIAFHVDGYVVKPFEFEALNFELFKISKKLKTLEENEEYKAHLQEILEKQTQEMNENYEKTLFSMVELIEQRDTYTAGHSKRVAYYCKLIAEEMGYSKEDVTRIHQAGILHDIGKIETPDSVLLNPMKLNDIEYKLIQEHVSVGYKLLKRIPMFAPLAKIVYQHHEHYDGTGYPNALEGEEIEPLAHIMIVADAFDAMTTNRIYKGRKTLKEALHELEHLATKQFHPEVVASAKRVLVKVEIDENINQLPQSKLEKERFAYFYNDRLSEAYNQNYLEVVLMKNNYEKSLHHMYIFSIHSFSSYNRRYGWSEGDKLLAEFGNTLVHTCENSLVFRVFGDDFILLSKEALVLEDLLASLDSVMSKKELHYKMTEVNLNERKIETLRDVEKEFLSKK